MARKVENELREVQVECFDNNQSKVNQEERRIMKGKQKESVT